MYDKGVSNDTKKTQEMCNKVVDYFLPPIKFVPDWFVTSNKMIKELLGASFGNDDKMFLMKILVMLHFLVMKFLL